MYMSATLDVRAFAKVGVHRQGRSRRRLIRMLQRLFRGDEAARQTVFERQFAQQTGVIFRPKY